jgi:hypothetical protein
MTIETLLVALESTTPGDWFLDTECFNGAIRRVDNAPAKPRVCCPLTALTNEKDTVLFTRAGHTLGLSREDTTRVAVTADNYTAHSDFDPVLRLKLLRATVNRSLGRRAA